MAEDQGSDRELSEHLISEFGDRGRDAVAFLETARGLIADHEDTELPRRAGAAAYCVREALKRLLPSQSGRPSWRKLSNEVLEAEKRFRAVRGLPGSDEGGALEELLEAIARLEEFKEKEHGEHQRRLADLLEVRTGAQPLRTALVEYQRLLREIDEEAVHSSASVEHVRELLGRAVSLLRTLFAPFQVRRPELDSLARLVDPGEEDLERLLPLCSTPHHVSYFLQHAVTPKWLSLLAPQGIIDPPLAGGVWPVLHLVERLAPSHGEEIARWLDDAYARWGASEVGAAYMAAAARVCLPHASDVLLRALRAYPRSQWIRFQATKAVEVMDVRSNFVDAVAIILLDPNDEVALTGVARRMIQSLVEGMTPDNAAGRIVLLARKLSEGAETHYLLFSLMPSGSIEDVAEEEGRGTGMLLKGILSAVRRARAIGLPTERVLALLEPMPPALFARVRTWALNEATDVAPEVLVAEISHAIEDRNPSAEDVRLIERITREFPPALYIGAWSEAMGTPPTPEEAGATLSSRDLPREWQRASLWHQLLPDSARQAWDTAVMLMSPVLTAPRSEDYLQPPSKPELEAARSPITKSDLEGLGVEDAARRISSWRPTGDHLTIARELGRNLEDLVSANPQAWASRPLEVLTLLGHATYVHHYFEGLAKTSGDLLGLGPQLVEAVVFARTHPWATLPLGDDDFDYDPTWEPADDAGIALIGRLAERDVDLADRYDDAWRVLLAGARDRSRESTIVSPREDPLEMAINRPCTRALEAVFHLIATGFRRGGTVRKEGLDLLDEALDLGGWNGAEHRAIIAPRLAFLLHVAPEWVESREGKLLGAEAPDDLGQKTVELALKWGRPNRWLLERHRRAVRRAVREEAGKALDHFLVGMLWEVPGYSVEETVRALAAMGASIVSDAGERAARLLMQDAEQDHIERGIRFWRGVLGDSSMPGEGFSGFGWWAEVEGLGRDEWEYLTLASCDRAQGTLDWCVEVAERCTREPINRVEVSILASLLLGRHEPWDRSRIAEIALRVLKLTHGEASLSNEQERLRATLTDLGYFEAADM